MITKRGIGIKYEQIAKEYLIKKGLKFVQNNYYSRYGEIDLIFYEKDTKTLVFIEIKYRKNNNYGMAIEMVNKKKQEKIKITSQKFMQEKNWNGNVRYDIIGIEKSIQNINWIKNAF